MPRDDRCSSLKIIRRAALLAEHSPAFFFFGRAVLQGCLCSPGESRLGTGSQTPIYSPGRYQKAFLGAPSGFNLWKWLVQTAMNFPGD